MAKNGGLVCKQEFDYLSAKEFNIPKFYIIPKMHKSLNKTPRRPMVSAVKGPLEKTGRYLDSLLKKKMVMSLKSYVKDTRDILANISNLTLEEEVWLVGVVVESFYT